MATTKEKQQAKSEVARVVAETRLSFVNDYGIAWDFGQNWSGVDFPDFKTYLNDYLFPKLNETTLINIALGNRFDWIAKDIEFIGQYSEEYVFMDVVPIGMNLTKPEELMLKRNYPRMATKFYREGLQEKMKFTINDNEARLKFQTLGDGVTYAVGLLKHHISQINVNEESKIKGMCVDYALSYTADKRPATSMQELFQEVFTGILDLQENSPKHNETSLASGGAIGRRTTVTSLSDIMIITTNEAKRYLLDTQIANTFQIAGLDPTRHITSFSDLGGVYRVTADFQITSQATIDYMRTYGDYQVAIGDTILKDTVFTYDVSAQDDFKGNIVEIKPAGDLFAFVVDINKIRYNRYTKNMVTNFVNNEFDETNHWVKYYSEKRMSPFFNNILVHGSTS